MNYLYIALTIVFTVYGQLVLKWQVSQAGAMPELLSEKISFILGLLFNPWVLTAFGAAFAASLTWMAALSKFDLSYAYPFTSLSFIMVAVLSTIVFNESMTFAKIIGLLLIVLGLIVGSLG